MASASQSHSAFASRPYSSSFQPSNKLPERSVPLNFGVREAARLERDRQERERSAAAAATAAQQAATAATGSNQTAMAQLTDEQRDEINEAFTLFDLDKDQLVDYHEFKVALKALGFDLSKPDLLALLTQHGIPHPTKNPQSQAQQHSKAPAAKAEPVPPSRLYVALPAFQSIASGLIAARDPRDEILRAFQLFDTEGKGMITLEDLRRVARELNEGLEEDELIAMIDEFDLEGKGGVGVEEFVGICMG